MASVVGHYTRGNRKLTTVRKRKWVVSRKGHSLPPARRRRRNTGSEEQQGNGLGTGRIWLRFEPLLFRDVKKDFPARALGRKWRGEGERWMVRIRLVLWPRRRWCYRVKSKKWPMQQASRAKIDLTVITSNLQVRYASVTKISKFKLLFL